MYTYASQDVAASELAVWRVEMKPGSSGPVHVVDTEQVLVILTGELEVEIEGQTHVLGPDESVVLRAGDERQVRNTSNGDAVAMAAARAGARVTAPGKENVAIPWAA
jgi:quercetin dioxygenase-like cupin family protein